MRRHLTTAIAVVTVGLVFSLQAQDSVPTISSLSPNATNAAGASFTLTVNGTGFVPTSTVQWNGSNRATSYLSTSQLSASINASDVLMAGSINIAVVSAGTGSSPVVDFIVYPPVSASASFVSPNGSDSNPGTISQPFLTIQHCAVNVTSGGTCAVRAGTYRETVKPNSGITITSYYGENVTVDGSDPVTGWAPYQGAIYSASVILTAGDTNQVFVGIKMMTEARWPNGNDLFHVNWATAQGGTTTSEIFDSNLPNINWTGATIHLWSGSDPWSPQTGVVTASTPGELVISGPSSGFCPYICPTAGGYYYLTGILGALDAPNEWFYDSDARLLYFWAPTGGYPDTLGVRAKRRQYAFDLSGRSNVTIQNIDIFAATINTDASSTNNILDGINGQYVSHFSTLPLADGDTTGFSGWYAHVADSGIVLNGNGNVLRNSTISYSAGNGVAVAGNNSSITNNLIQNTGYMGGYASGISLYGDGDSIQNNTIHTSGRFSIFLGGPENNPYPTNDDISYNNFFSAMILSRDGGEIYTGTTVSGTSIHIHNNWFHDTQSLITGPADNYALSGVYLDQDATGFEVDQNVFWNNEYYNIFLNGSELVAPNSNKIHNNSIIDVRNTGYIWLQNIPNCGTTQITNNLVLVPVVSTNSDPACSITNNNSNAAGATGMSGPVQVGCHLAGCYSAGPPAISGTFVGPSIAIQPSSLTVTAGQKATFAVTAAGSTPLSYQWQRDGTNIAAATGTTYGWQSTTVARDNGAVFTVVVSNSLGNTTSNSAILTLLPSRCDLNNQGTVNVSDVQLIINESLGVVPATNDLNYDGAVNVVDVQIVIAAALGLSCAGS